MSSENGDIHKNTAGIGDIHNGQTASPPTQPSRSFIQKDVNVQKIKERANRLKVDVLDKLDGQLQELVEDFVHEVEKIEHAEPLDGSSSRTPRTDRRSRSENSRHRRRNGDLPDKEFVDRRSVLTELLEINHIRTIYHIFVAILIVFSLNTMAYDLLDKGRLHLNFDLIVYAFGGFSVVVSVWLCMILSTVAVVYPLFQYWASSRRPGKVYWLDFIWLTLYIVYQWVFVVLPLKSISNNNLPPASTVVVVTEQIRLLMKAHAFVRENVPRVLNYKKNDDQPEMTLCPHFSKYLYFLFAPTLVYRDNYPRTRGPVRWNYVVSNFVQVLACLFYIYYIFERFCVPVFRNFGEEPVTVKRLTLSVFGCMMPGTLVLFIGFFAILHSWLNAFAEMLRFADRLFYKDWWNSSSFANYYRTWNVVVHDWLYSYIYKDIYKLLGNPNRAVAMLTVFLLSAVWHEYILTVSFGFFYPILFVLFAGAGFGFIFLPNKGAPRSGNVFMWVALFIGNGMLMCLYSMEWYARKNCPATMDSFLDLLVPRSWTCGFSGIHATGEVAPPTDIPDIPYLHLEL